MRQRFHRVTKKSESMIPKLIPPTLSLDICHPGTNATRFTTGNPNASLPAPATTFGGIESAQAAAQAAVAALGVVSLARPTTTLRLNNMLTAGDLEDEPGLGDIEEETKVRVAEISFPSCGS